MSRIASAEPGEWTLTSVVRWVLLTGDRLVVSMAVLLAAGAVFVLAGVTGVAAVAETGRVMWYLNGAVNGLLTLIPISVGVNQIVLSQELGSIQDYHERRSDITEFREHVEEKVDASVTSPFASQFFGTLLDGIADTARALHRDDTARRRDDAASPDDARSNDGLLGDLDATAAAMEAEADRANAKLDPGETTMLRTLFAMLQYDDSVHENRVRELLDRAPEFDDPVVAQLERLQALVVDVDTARQYLKTLVVEQQLAQLSMSLIYTGIPAVAVAAIGIFSYRDLAGVTLPRVVLVLVAGGLVAATLLPLVLLAVYVLRVATIARATAAFGPFVPESKR